jgi:hypothetical protein
VQFEVIFPVGDGEVAECSALLLIDDSQERGQRQR